MKYTKQQICEAIKHWKRVLAKLDESSIGGITDEQWEEAYNWFEEHGFTVHDSDEGGFTFYEPIDGENFYSGKDGWELYQRLRDEGASRKPFDMSKLPFSQYEKNLDGYWEEYKYLFDKLQSDEDEGLDAKMVKVMLGIAKQLKDNYSSEYHSLANRIVSLAFDETHSGKIAI